MSASHKEADQPKRLGTEQSLPPKKSGRVDLSLKLFRVSEHHRVEWIVGEHFRVAPQFFKGIRTEADNSLLPARKPPLGAWPDSRITPGAREGEDEARAPRGARADVGRQRVEVHATIASAGGSLAPVMKATASDMV